MQRQNLRAPNAPGGANAQYAAAGRAAVAAAGVGVEPGLTTHCGNNETTVQHKIVIPAVSVGCPRGWLHCAAHGRREGEVAVVAGCEPDYRCACGNRHVTPFPSENKRGRSGSRREEDDDDNESQAKRQKRTIEQQQLQIAAQACQIAALEAAARRSGSSSATRSRSSTKKKSSSNKKTAGSSKKHAGSSKKKMVKT